MCGFKGISGCGTIVVRQRKHFPFVPRHRDVAVRDVYGLGLAKSCLAFNGSARWPEKPNGRAGHHGEYDPALILRRYKKYARWLCLAAINTRYGQRALYLHL